VPSARAKACQCLSELQVGDQAKAAGKSLAGDFTDLPAYVQADRFQSAITQCFDNMAVRPVAGVEEAERLQQFVRPARQLFGKVSHGTPLSLLGDMQHMGTIFFRCGGAG
jgi:hypothetical protein